MEDVKERENVFLAESVAWLRSLSFDTLVNGPNWPEQPSFGLQVPNELSKYKLTLMKDMLASGDVRIGIQRYREGFLGLHGKMVANGFAKSPDESMRPLTEQDQWDLT